MLPVDNKFLLEEKTISYVTSGREVIRLASAKSNVQHSKSLVMGNPDFDFDLKSKRVTQVANSKEDALGKSGTPVPRPSENGLVVTRSLSRDYRDLKFKPLEGRTPRREVWQNCLAMTPSCGWERKREKQS